MASGRRPGKRSIVGTRVCAPLVDGLLYPGVIVAVRSAASMSDPASRTSTQQSYTVRFDINGSTQNCRETDVFGVGFQSVTVARLKPGQTVYVTYNGREMKGCVERRRAQRSVSACEGGFITGDEVWQDCEKPCSWDEVWVLVDGESKPLRRKVEEVRLMESRKSARLQHEASDNQHMHTAQPFATPNITRFHGDLYSGQTEEMMQFDDDYDDDVDDDRAAHNVPMFDYNNVDSSERMDEHMAALVLTSLSCSPASPRCMPGGTHVRQMHPSVGSSGLGTSCSPSPPKSLLSHSAPADVNTFTYFRCDMETVDADDSAQGAAKRILFKCAWPRCGRVYSTCPAVEKHIRIDHLGPRDDSNVDMSDHEEEFYYTEVEENVNAVMRTFADMQTMSPTRATFAQLTEPASLPDHDYQRKSLPLSIPKSSFGRSHQLEVAGYTTSVVPREVFSLPSSLPGTDGSSGFMAWPPSTLLAHSCDSQEPDSPANNHFILKSTPSISGHRRSRTDVKKCRKVYGIENRAMWCTQCKWKKACNRFQEHRADDNS